MMLIESTEGKGENNNKQAKLVLLELWLGFFRYMYILTRLQATTDITERQRAHLRMHFHSTKSREKKIVIIIENRQRNKGERAREVIV